MSEFIPRQAADTIWGVWQAGGQINRLSGSAHPETVEDGQAVQLHYAELADSPISGWKIAASSKAGQASINVGGPIEGPYLDCQTRDSGATVSMRGNHMALAEAEFAFVAGDDIPIRSKAYEWDEIADAVAQLRPSLELPDCRFPDPKAASEAYLLADCACSRLCVLGDPFDGDFKDSKLDEHRVELRINGDIAAHGPGSDALGDPRIAFTWLVNRLMKRGIALLSGQFVTTGLCGKPMPVATGDHVVADLGRFGIAEAHLVD